MNINQNFTSIRQIQETYLQQSHESSKTQENETQSFSEIFRQRAGLNSDKGLDALKFSKHADARLADRNISLSQEQLERLEEGARRADEKGIRESLVIMDNLSFIVNVKNRTVITAMDMNSNDNVYTNIDGAVVI
jgi:flagellar operon protein